VSIDPAIWRRRAELTILLAKYDAIDRGSHIDDVEPIVRRAPCPFGEERTLAWQFWVYMLDEAFPVRRRRRKGGDR
jgi:hypothetical protein